MTIVNAAQSVDAGFAAPDNLQVSGGHLSDSVLVPLATAGAGGDSGMHRETIEEGYWLMASRDTPALLRGMCWSVALALIAVVCWNAYVAYSGRVGSGPLRCDEADFDFGCVQPGASVKHSFHVRNTGIEGLTIRRVLAECGCMRLHDALEGRTLSPGEMCEVAVTLELGESVVGNVQKKVVVFCDGSGPSNVVLRFHGEVERAVQTAGEGNKRP